MRARVDGQMNLGTPSILEVELDLDCRHELVPILKGLQHLYSKQRLRDKILELIRQDLVGAKSSQRGCPGMSCWEVLVLAGVRLGCDLDYDALHDLANCHRALRQVMGVGVFDVRRFPRSTVNDNVSRLRVETLEAISQAIVGEGHRVTRTTPKRVRVDGFVVDTNIHYPTEANLMLDGLRKMLELAADVSAESGVGGWRQHKHLLKIGKRLFREICQVARSRKDKTERLRGLYAQLLQHVREIAARCRKTIEVVEKQSGSRDVLERIARDARIKELARFIDLTLQVCDIGERRVIHGEPVPREDKLFSLFETHTQMIHRGKQPNPIEFGRHVVVVEDQLGFMLEHRVLEAGELEQDVALPVIAELQTRHNGSIQSASFDKGFYTPDNLKQLSEKLALPCLPKKGKATGEALKRESDPAFRKARRRHPGIESAIHALVAGNGLDRCRDKGEAGFRRYVALAMLGRNLQTLGRLLMEKERRQRQRQTAQAIAA